MCKTFKQRPSSVTLVTATLGHFKTGPCKVHFNGQAQIHLPSLSVMVINLNN